MKFGTIDTRDAIGSILAHRVKSNGVVLKKGTILTNTEIAVLNDGDVKTVIAARPEFGDVLEDEAADRIAAVIAGSSTVVADAYTGRANIFSKRDGVFIADSDWIKDLNRVDDAMTVATLNPFARVASGQMVATVKIIPFSVCEDKLFELERIGGRQSRSISVAPFRPLNIGLIISRVTDDKDSVISKRHEAVEKRVLALGGRLNSVVQCAHTRDGMTKAIRDIQGVGNDLTLVFGASAIVDRADVIPAALECAQGNIIHLGMPVDPGNLLLYGEISNTKVIGIPSCASSIKENGFDWVLERTFAGFSLTREDFIAMAPGGLLKEISTRPHPRESVAIEKVSTTIDVDRQRPTAGAFRALG